MDNPTSRGYATLGPWSKAGRSQQNVYNPQPIKTLSKLDNAKIRLSQLKQKYGKHEKQEEDSSLSLSSEDHTSLNLGGTTNAFLKDNLNAEKTSSEESTSANSSKKISDDSLVAGLKDKSPADRAFTAGPVSPKDIIPTKSFIYDQPQLENNSSSDSSLSEVEENVHSFSSLLKSETQGDSLYAAEKDRAKTPVPVTGAETLSALEGEEISTTGSSAVASISSELSGKKEIVQMASELAAPQVRLEIPKLQASGTQRSDPSLQSDQQIRVTRISRSSSIGSLSSKLENRKETSSVSSFSKYSPSKSPDKISSSTLAPGEKGPREMRHAKIQTDTKRSRQIQVDLSWTESEYDRRSCPILRASSLPHGLRIADDTLDECFDVIGVEDAMQVLLNSQLRLTLGLLQREQAVYINSCSAAARLEKGYRQHTLSDTLKFIRGEKRLRGKLRRDAKLEKEGTALLRKQ